MLTSSSRCTSSSASSLSSSASKSSSAVGTGKLASAAGLLMAAEGKLGSACRPLDAMPVGLRETEAGWRLRRRAPAPCARRREVAGGAGAICGCCSPAWMIRGACVARNGSREGRRRGWVEVGGPPSTSECCGTVEDLFSRAGLSVEIAGEQRSNARLGAEGDGKPPRSHGDINSFTWSVFTLLLRSLALSCSSGTAGATRWPTR